MTEMVYGALPQRAREPVIPKWWQTLDKWTMTSILLLFCIGLMLGMAASPPLAAKNGFEPFHYVKKQVVFGGAAMVAMVVTSMMTPTLVRRLSVVGFAVAMVAMMLLPIFGTDFGKGATRWYSLGFASLQPSEFLKPGFVVVCAWLMAANEEINGPPGRRWSFLLMMTIVFMLAMQPDFGQACLILFGWSVMYFVSGAPMMLIGGICLSLIPVANFAYNNSEHFARRIDGFLDRSVDPTTQIGYATEAIREGGLFGVGVGEGQVKWSLPDAHTDFIISVAAEEYGLILVFAIMFLYATIVLRSYFRLMRERDPFIRLAGTGLVAIFGVQALVNMGVAVRLLPSKGMTLPFVSYGGSSLIAGGIAVGMILAFTRSRPQGELSDILRGHTR
ncbi:MULTISPECIES: putative lipid II flippase FtsW [unclassified Shimia]|uniref:putative lipid II flippase FtsW n=1 Tax=unclassified Shimia TaxID=2630038 RepID=UPI003108B041